MALRRYKRYCPCVVSGCPRHGFCGQCKAYHAESKGQPLPSCKRQKKAEEAQTQEK